MSLEASQRWLQAAILQPGDDGAAFSCSAVRLEMDARVEDVVKPSACLSALERAGVYRGMYRLRMREALAVDYPCLRHFLGADGFEELVDGYVARCPSTSYTLNRLGDRLPDYIAGAPTLPESAFLAQLARFELDMTEVFDARETAALTAEEWAEWPPQTWGEARLHPIAALRLRRFDCDIPAAHEACRHDEPIVVRARPSYVVLHRWDYRVYRLDLTAAGFDLLADLLAGAPLGAAIERAFRAGDEVTPERVFAWFQSWVGERIFHRIDQRRNSSDGVGTAGLTA